MNENAFRAANHAAKTMARQILFKFACFVAVATDSDESAARIRLTIVGVK